MRYDHAVRLMRLAVELQTSPDGLSIADIERRYGVSRRTALRMRDAVARAFEHDFDYLLDGKAKRWRLRLGEPNLAVDWSEEDASSLAMSIGILRDLNMDFHARKLADVEAKLRLLQVRQTLLSVDADLETIGRAEGIAFRPGPREDIDQTILGDIRFAIKASRYVSFRYTSRSGQETLRVRVKPVGLLYGHRHYLLGGDSSQERPKLFTLSQISGLCVGVDMFEWDSRFSVQEFCRSNFGVFDEEPRRVEWRFSPQVAAVVGKFQFHPSQTTRANTDGSLTVEFTAGGLVEMAWHLVMWGAEVEVIAPDELKLIMPEQTHSWPVWP